MELSLLPGKLVLTPAGEALGYIKCAYVNKNLDALTCLSCVNDEEETFAVPAKAIKSVGDAVLAESEPEKAVSGVPCPVGRAVFDALGNFSGHCSGFELEKGLLLVGLPEEKRRYRIKDCAIGEVIIVPCKEKRASTQKKQERPIKNGTKPSVKAKERTIGRAPSKGKEETGLLGKQVKKSVADVAETGETVTPATLKRARENNKLLELTANTLTE